MTPENFCYWLRGFIELSKTNTNPKTLLDVIRDETDKLISELELKNKKLHYILPTPSEQELDEWKKMLQDGPHGSWDEEPEKNTKEIRDSLLDSCAKTAYEQIIDKETKAWINAGSENWTCGYNPKTEWPPAYLWKK